MKHLIQLTTALFLLVQTIGFSQSEKPATNLKEQIETVEIDTKNYERFIGVYFLEEADFELEIVMENGKMYIISPFSKDPLEVKNETTLHEPTRGVDLERIEGNDNALKYTQNAYETTMSKVTKN